MKRIIQVHISKGEKYYIAECADLSLVTQGKTLDGLVENLQEAIELRLEGENLKEMGISLFPSILSNFEIQSKPYAQI